MAKKVKNPEKLQAEINLQRSKMQSLKVLDAEIEEKIKRLEFQRQSIREKYNKLNYALNENLKRAQGPSGH